MRTSSDLPVVAMLYVSLFFASAGYVQAGAGFERKLNSIDTTAFDTFGNSVSVSGNTIIVGANQDDDLGTNSGSAYVFDASTGSQVFKLTASDGAEGHWFGHSVGVKKNYVIVGAPTDFDKAASNTGSAYLFNASTGNQFARLTASDAELSDQFGWSVAIGDHVAIVSAPGDSDAGNASGSAYLFDVLTGNQLAKITADDATAGDLFGWSVAIDQSTAIVGARYDDVVGFDSGSAYLFDAVTGTQISKLVSTDAEAFDVFGFSVAISGEYAIVGAPGDDGEGSEAGSAYVFDVNTGFQLAKLSASDALPGDGFGASVAISGNLAIVGASGSDVFAGSAYLFDVTTGIQLAKLSAYDATESAQFGGSVAASGSKAVFGAAYDDDFGRLSGSAYVFLIPEPSCLFYAIALAVYIASSLGRQKCLLLAWT